jgi:tetratricopeptide (TPR) repeat protein
MEQYPNDPQGFHDAAGYYADFGDWQNARELFEQEHQLDPKSAVSLIALGQVSREMKDFTAARKYYQQALDVDPNGRYAEAARKALRELKN